ncbi:TonB-dependent receptor [Neiella litorisoli]|nr:TonB-dependent receptor [Neiella litorisoli]
MPVLAAEPATAEDAASGDVEIIHVKGFRGSLNKAMFEKRASTNVKDSIMSEDIGKFPDLNIAESLQRVPGVAISREGGEGRQITLRGLSPSFTRSTLNGMEVPSSTDGTDSGGGVNNGRGFDFNVFASELFNRVDINKSPTASMEEGGIAGTVDLYSAKPFDSMGFHLAASGQLGYNDLSEEKDPRVSAMISNTFMDDTVGVLLSAAYSERTVRQEGFGTVRWTNPVADGGGIYADTSNTVVNGTPNVGNCEHDGEAVDPVNCLWTPRLPRPDFFGNDQDRFGFTGALQYAPSDDVKITFDTLYSKLENSRTMYNMFEMFRSTFDEITPVELTVADNGRQVLAGTFDGVKNRIESRNQESKTDFSQYVLSGEFALTDTLTLNGLLGTAESDARSEQYRYNMTNQTAHRFGFDFSKDKNAPELIYDYDYNDASSYDLKDGRLRATDVLRENDTAKLDLDYAGDEVNLKVGIAYNDRSVDYKEEQINGFPDQASAVGFTREFPYSDFGTGFDGGSLPKFIVADFAAINDQLLEKDWTQRTAQSWKVSEETYAGYIELNGVFTFADMDLRTNFGMRVVRTETESTGYLGDEKVSIDGDYTNFLPALNLALDLTDDIVIRSALSTTMTRPSLSSLNPGNPRFDYINGSVNVGNPELEPFVSNNFDFGVEWYFDEESMIAATFFYKDIQDYITSDSVDKLVDEAYLPFIYEDPNYDPQISLDPAEVPYTHNTPVNLDEQDINGYELVYQQHFSFLPAPFDNLGALANYTKVSSGKIEGLSEDSYNATVYYETDDYGIRVSMNKRDDYITDYTGSNGNAEHGTTGPTHVDLSAFYNFNENLTFTFEGINLTDEHERLFTTGEGDLNLVREYNHTGRQYFLGVRYVM